MKIGDMIFVKGSRTLYQVPLVIMDIQLDNDYILLDPVTGIRYWYQKHDLVSGSS